MLKLFVLFLLRLIFLLRNINYILRKLFWLIKHNLMWSINHRRKRSRRNSWFNNSIRTFRTHPIWITVYIVNRELKLLFVFFNFCVNCLLNRNNCRHSRESKQIIYRLLWAIRKFKEGFYVCLPIFLDFFRNF